MRRMFCRYSLRTLDVEAAREFYREVVGLDFSASPTSSGIDIWPLHEQARARGAPPHWLGQLAVANVEVAMGRLLDLGAERLGPTLKGQDGGVFATLRDPTGAVIALRETRSRPERVPVAWHHLHTRDRDRAWAVYSELCGWQEKETVPVENVEGGTRIFAWDRSRESVGSMANTARWPGVHVHWLFGFPTTDLEAASTLVIEKGGKALEPFVLPNGGRIVPCDDPQGAAFALFSSTR